MKHSSGTASNLYQSIHQQLSVYAGAAVVAMVSVLALTQPSEAKIVYTSANVHMFEDGHYKLDLNHDGITDFTLKQVAEENDQCYPKPEFVALYLQETPVQGDGAADDTKGFPKALDKGVEIGPNLGFNSAAADMAYFSEGYGPPACQNDYFAAGNWLFNVTNRFLGLRFQIKGKTHYAWTRLSVVVMILFGDHFIDSVLTGYAYETIPGKSIKAGQTKEAADDPANEDFGPGASLTNPIPDTPQPAALVMVALGAQGVPLWRRKESALEGDLKGGLL